MDKILGTLSKEHLIHHHHRPYITYYFIDPKIGLTNKCSCLSTNSLQQLAVSISSPNLQWWTQITLKLHSHTNSQVHIPIILSAYKCLVANMLAKKYGLSTHRATVSCHLINVIFILPLGFSLHQPLRKRSGSSAQMLDFLTAHLLQSFCCFVMGW